MSREQEIKARAKAATAVLVKQCRYQSSPPVVPASYQENLRQLVAEDIPYLLAELKTAREKLEAVKAYLDRAKPFKEFPVVSPAEVFRDHLINLDRILKWGE